MDVWSKAIVAAVERVRPSVLHVTSQDDANERIAFGSGILIDHYHAIATAGSTAAGNNITVRLTDDRQVRAELVAVDPLYFISVLKFEERVPIDPAPFGDPEMSPGQLVLAMGNPTGFDRSVSMGIICGLDRTVYRPERVPVDGLIVTDASVHPGNSGGPLASLEGRILGVNGVPWVNNLSLAVPSDVVLRVANQIIEYGRASHPWLGFSGEPEVLDPKLVDLFGLPADRGVVVEYVAPEGPGQAAGIKLFDMVVRVDGKPVGHLGFIRSTLANHRLGEKGTLSVLRADQLIEVPFPVEDIPRLRELT